MRRMIPWLIPLFTLGLGALVIECLPQSLYYPEIRYQTAEGLGMHFIHPGLSATECAKTLKQMTQSLPSTCPACLRLSRCAHGLEASQQGLFSSAPWHEPMLRHDGGVIGFTAPSPEVALALCRQTAAALTQGRPGAKGICFNPGEPRPLN